MLRKFADEYLSTKADRQRTLSEIIWAIVILCLAWPGAMILGFWLMKDGF